jgi:hypothetical protein
MLDLFPETLPSHDPGGKIRNRLPPEVQGDAEFSPCQRYRTVLRRWIGASFPTDFVLWVGMNPSTADASVNDPTIGREWEFTRREGYSGFVKVNVADYRATDPKAFLGGDITPCSPANIGTILDWAGRASLVVLCHGKLNRGLTAAGRETVAALQGSGIAMVCLGNNADGSPRHPLYLRADTPFQPFHGDNN